MDIIFLTTTRLLNAIFSHLLRDYLKINERALKNYYTLSWLHRFQKRITQIFLIFQCISYLCNRSLIDVIRDFWTFSEIPIYLDIEQRIVYKETKSSCKESFFGRERNPQRTPNSFFAGFFMKSRRVSYQDLPKVGKKWGMGRWI
jgi:hypothetical protein